MTMDERKKLFEALSKPFPPEAIERTDGKVTGRGYSTTGIKYQYVANRLNEVLGAGGWRVHRTVTVREFTSPNGRKMFEAICDMTLEIGEFVDGQFVPVGETLGDGGHSSISESDARKGATSNALKKCAALFGCGRQAYEGTLDDDHLPVEADGFNAVAPVPAQRPVQQVPAPTAPQVQRAASGTQRQRLTSKQLAAIWASARRLGFDQRAFREQIKIAYGCVVEFLSSTQASELITSLNNGALKPNGHAEAVPQEGA